MPNQYKYCIVPGCLSTTIKTPNKRFFLVPMNEVRRKAWIRAVKTQTEYSKKINIYVCEDHFNLEEDAENWLKVRFGANKKVSLKNNVVPHIFQCQPERSNAQLVQERPAAAKRARKSLIQRILPSPVKAGLSSTCTVRGNVTSTKNACKVVSPKNNQDIPLVNPSKEQLVQLSSPFKEAQTQSTCENREQQQLSPSRHSIDINPQKRRAVEALCEMFNKHTRHLHNPHAASDEQKQSEYNVEGSFDSTAQTVPKSSISKEYRSMGVTARPSRRSKHIQFQRSPKQQFKTIAKLPFKLQKDQLALNEDTESSSLSKEFSSSSYKPSTDASNSDERGYVKKWSAQQVHLEKVKSDPMYYIGVPAEYYYLMPVLSECVLTSLLNVLICLQKVRLNQSFKGLAYDYGVSESFCSKVFCKIIPDLAECLSTLILWPDRLIKERLPFYFYARYYNVQSIIDCFEVEIEKPSDPVSQILSWSNYKICHTLKYSISCTPDGFINDVSGGFGGRCSNAKIIECYGYSDVLPVSVCIMADRGFKGVARLLPSKDCELLHPPSVLSSELSSREQVRTSKTISSSRFHVERIIRRVREFTFLEPYACVNRSLCKYTDYVVKIVCGLVNLQIKKFA